MPTLLAIPDNYGYILAVAATSTTLNVFHSLLTGSRRRAAGVPYPNAYAPASEAEKSPEKLAFNGAQRGHANFTENYTHFLVALGIAGLEHPKVAAGLGASWIVARALYAWGYARDAKGGKGRLIGAWGSLPLLGLTGLAVWGSVRAVL